MRELGEDMDAWEGGVISRLARDVANGVLIARVGALTVLYKVVLQKSIPAQIRQLILYFSNNEG